MMLDIKLFFSAIVMCFLMDMLWLAVIAKNIYGDAIGFLLRKQDGSMDPNWLAVVVVYIAIAAGIVIFALPKAGNSHLQALMWGAVFGAILYGVYDFTNYALLNGWPLSITLIDCVWGMTLCGVTACFTSVMKQYFIS